MKEKNVVCRIMILLVTLLVIVLAIVLMLKKEKTVYIKVELDKQQQKVANIIYENVDMWEWYNKKIYCYMIRMNRYENGKIIFETIYTSEPDKDETIGYLGKSPVGKTKIGSVYEIIGDELKAGNSSMVTDRKIKGSSRYWDYECNETEAEKKKLIERCVYLMYHSEEYIDYEQSSFKFE